MLGRAFFPGFVLVATLATTAVFGANIPVITVPAAPPAQTDPVGLIEKNLKEDTQVIHYNFSAIVPKGWSVQAEGYPSASIDKDHSSASVLVSPTDDFTHSKVTEEIDSLGYPMHTLDQLFDQAKRDHLSKARYVTWNNQRWLLIETDDPAHGLKKWTAHSMTEGMEFLVTANAPITETSRYEKPILGMMSSIVLSPQRW